jgi:hypothetical protein
MIHFGTQGASRAPTRTCMQVFGRAPGSGNPLASIFRWSAACCLTLTSLGGCLPIDRRPLTEIPAYRDSQSRLAQLGPQELRSGPFLAGASRVEITPPPGTPLAGYGARLSVGRHDPVYARALALSNGQVTVLLISVELLAITNDLYEAVEGRIRRELPLRPGNLLVAATHTHSGPGAIGKRFAESLASGPFDPRQFNRIADRIAEAAIGAHRRMAPARLGFGRVPAPEFIQNRIVHDETSDPDLSVLWVSMPEAAAYLINYSAHPTVLRSKNRMASGDFPGVLSRVLEAEPNTVALYATGAGGDQRPRPPDGPGVFVRAEAMGRALAERVRAMVPALVPADHGVMGTLTIAVPLPPSQIRLSTGWRLPSFMGNRLLDSTTTVQVLRIHDTMWVAVPCDLGAEIGLAIKRHAAERGLQATVVGLANDYIGYVIPERLYDTPAYEARLSFNGPHMDRYLFDIITELMDRL